MGVPHATEGSSTRPPDLAHLTGPTLPHDLSRPGSEYRRFHGRPVQARACKKLRRFLQAPDLTLQGPVSIERVQRPKLARQADVQSRQEPDEAVAADPRGRVSSIERSPSVDARHACFHARHPYQ